MTHSLFALVLAGGSGERFWPISRRARPKQLLRLISNKTLLEETIARLEGLFDWLATHAVRHARGSAKRLFLIVYGVGTLVTILLSNDATAVVLTPAVYAAATAARVAPLPYLFVCAFIANAASFVLPISNPANLVIFGTHMPPLARWLYHFTLPSIASIVVTYAALRFTQRRALDTGIHNGMQLQPLSLGGKCAAVGIIATAIALIAASAFDRPLGLPTFLCGVAATLGTRRGYVNVCREMLLDDMVMLLPPERFVLEVLETVTVDALLLERIDKLRRAGFRIALDDICELSDELVALLPHIDIVKIDFLHVDRERLPTLAAAVQEHGRTLVAEKIETQDDYALAHGLGFDLFQGYFFARPQVLSVRRGDPSRESLLRMLALIASEAPLIELETEAWARRHWHETVLEPRPVCPHRLPDRIAVRIGEALKIGTLRNGRE